MNIGYACLAIGVVDTQMKSCTMKNASEERLIEIIDHNLKSLGNMVDYNVINGVSLFRISSEVIPFGSNSINQLEWWEIFSNELSLLGKKIQDNGIRVSMHPGQYTVLNSPDLGVVERAIADLSYHVRFLDSLGVDYSSKIVLHVGGAYGNKREALERFSINYAKLESTIKRRLVIENDDKLYNISEVLEAGISLGIPVVFDNLHNSANPSKATRSDKYWIDECRKTWSEQDGIQKIHYSQQDIMKKKGSHSKTICLSEFLEYYKKLERDDLDIMLEVKDKNLSAIKCINGTSAVKQIKNLELEWSKYKYKILENSPKDYLEIRKLLRNKLSYPVEEFYRLVEGALEKDSVIGYEINAAQHVWGYFKKLANEKEKREFEKNIEKYKHGSITINTIKKNLYKLTIKYHQQYLFDSYYFAL